MHDTQRFAASFLAAMIAFLITGPAFADDLNRPNAPTGLMVDLLRYPETTQIDRSTPQFSWIHHDPRRAARQSAWHVQLRQTNSETIHWDSGQVVSSESVAVAYQGPALAPSSSYAWQVRTWDQDGNVSRWSEPQTFNTASVLHDNYRLVNPDSVDRDYTNRPMPMQHHEICRDVIAVAPGRWYFDFGGSAFGNAVIRSENLPERMKDSQPLVSLAEKLIAPGELDRQPPGAVRFQQHRLRLSRDQASHQPPLTWTPPGWMKDGFLKPAPQFGQVMPFRYAMLEDAPLDFDPAWVERWWLSVPFDNEASHFRSSQPGLDETWDLCRYTVQATTFLGLYVDGDRERKPYEADTFVNQLAHYNVDRSYAIARYTLEYLLQRPTWPLEWQPTTVMIAWQDYLHTGDRRSLAACYERLTVKTLRGLARDDGLIDSSRQSPELLDALNLRESLRIVVDWPPNERDGHQVTRVDAVANAYYYRALVLMQKIAATLEKTDEAAAWGRDAERVRVRFHEVFFDHAQRRYRDGEGVDHGSLHANLFPLAFDLVPEPNRAEVLQWVKSRGRSCSVYAAHFLLEVLFRHGEAQAAIDWMASDGPRSWRNMIAQGATMTMEAWDQQVKPNQDWNHPWATGPAAAIGRYLVGVQPLEPGYRRLRIAPQPGNLEWFNAQVPTIRGPVRVDWRNSDGLVDCKLELPANTIVELQLPHGGWDSVREANRPVGEAPELRVIQGSDGHDALELGGGTYHFTFQIPVR
jgi:hypothetical protein